MELVLPQAGKMTHALKKLHIVERCFRTGAEGKAAPSALHESKGIFSFAKENIPFGTPRERRLDWQSRTRMTFMPPECRCLRGSIASLAANGSARRFASASIIRCRSADLAEVHPNHRLPIMHTVSIVRTAASAAMPPRQAIAKSIKSEVDGDCLRLPNRRQSDSKDRR